MFGGMDFMFGFMQIVFPIIFILVFAVILVNLVKGVGTWHKNNNSPRLTVEAAVVSKRTAVTHHNSTAANGAGAMHTSTSYYVTFQVESGDRMELKMSGSQYGMIAEGDRGKLTFQGTRYLDFQRQL